VTLFREPFGLPGPPALPGAKVPRGVRWALDADRLPAVFFPLCFFFMLAHSRTGLLIRAAVTLVPCSDRQFGS
jgi:hypothetical protein